MLLAFGPWGQRTERLECLCGFLPYSLNVSVRTGLKNRQTSVRVSKHQPALLGGVPPEEADVRQEGVGLFMHRDPGVGAAVHPDIQRAALRHEGHSIG